MGNQDETSKEYSMDQLIDFLNEQTGKVRLHIDTEAYGRQTVIIQPRHPEDLK